MSLIRIIPFVLLGITCSVTSNIYPLIEPPEIDPVQNIITVISSIVAEFSVKTSQYFVVTKSLDRKTEMHFGDVVNQISANQVDLKVQIDSAYRLPTEIEHQLLNVIMIDSVDALLSLHPGSKTINYTLSEFYLVYTTAPTEELPSLFEYFWDNYIINVDIIVHQQSDKVLLYTYFPFTNGHCRDITISLLNEYSGGQWLQSAVTYPEKMRNLFGCPVRAALWHMPPFIVVPLMHKIRNKYRGFDNEVLIHFSEYLNFSVDLRIPPNNEERGVVYPNWTTTGAFKMLQDKTADLSIGYLRLVYNRAMVVLPSKTYFQSYLIIAALSNIEPYSSVEILTFAFTYTTWICVLLTVLVGMATVFLAHFCGGGSTNSAAFNLMSSFLGQPTCPEPKKNFFRYCLIVWILGSFVMRCAYQSQMFHLLRTTLVKKPPQTIVELQSRQYTVVISKTVLESLSNMSFGSRSPLPTEVLPLLDIYAPVAYIEANSHRKLALIIPKEFINYYSSINRRQGAFNILRENVIAMQSTMYMTKHSFLIDIFNDFIVRLIEHGLISNWIERGLDLDAKITSSGKETHLISLTDLEGIFIIYGALLAMATVVFLFEIILFRFKSLERDPLM